MLKGSSSQDKCVGPPSLTASAVWKRAYQGTSENDTKEGAFLVIGDYMPYEKNNVILICMQRLPHACFSALHLDRRISWKGDMSPAVIVPWPTQVYPACFSGWIGQSICHGTAPIPAFISEQRLIPPSHPIRSTIQPLARPRGLLPAAGS